MRPLTPAQAAVVFDTHHNLLVSAGAGSGKTTTVVKHLCYLLGGATEDADGSVRVAERPLALHEIAAITFTRQAASDLKRKLRAALFGAGLRDMAYEVDSALIGTIHGFCASLRTGVALRAGVAPSQAVLNEGEARARAADAANAVIREAASGAIAADALAKLLSGRRLTHILSCITTLSRDPDRMQAWRANAHDLREHERTLLQLSERAAARYHERLRHDGVIDFDRMVTDVRDLLRRDGAVRHAAQRQIRVLVVDEFQDVSPAQRDIAMLLAGIDEPPTEPVQHVVPTPTPTRIVLVGDPKQSIYRFRGADVSLWQGVARHFADPAVGRTVSLDANFRSRSGILALVDTLIGGPLDTPVHEDGVRRPFEVDYAALSAAGPDKDGDEYVELLCIPPLADGKARAAGDVRAREAAAIAERVRELHVGGQHFGDIALLCTAWSDIDHYERALHAIGIPTYTLRQTGFWNTREVLDCLLALRAMLHQADDTALIGFLKGPFVMVRDDTIVALASAAHAAHRSIGEVAGGDAGLLDDVDLAPDQRVLLDRASVLLGRLRAMRDRTPLHMLLTELVMSTGFLAGLSLDAGHGVQAVANVRKLLRHARQSPARTVGECLRDVNDMRKRGDRADEARVHHERADAVTLTSVHSAKGLEWPVVFWCDLVRDIPSENSALLCGRTVFRLKDAGALALADDDDSAAMSGTDDAGGAEDNEDNAFTLLRDELRLEARAEALRLWYVASTRPRTLLVLSGVPLGALRKNARSVAARIREQFADELSAVATPSSIAYAGADGVRYRMTVRLTAADPIVALPRVETENERDADVAVDMSRVVLAPQPIVVRHGPSRLSASVLASHFRLPEPTERPVHAEPAIAIERAARVIGTAVHRVLERMAADAAPVDLDACIASALRVAVDANRCAGVSVDEAATRAWTAQVRTLVTDIRANGEWTRTAASSSARHELWFTYLTPEGETIEGVFDLVGGREAGRGAHILDAKTGPPGAELLRPRHGIQRATYVAAADAILGTSTSSFALVASDGASVEFTEPPIDLAELIVRIRHRS